MGRGKRRTGHSRESAPAISAPSAPGALSLSDLDAVSTVYATVARECSRVAGQGQWPSYIAPESILERLPEPSDTASGFDAGVACTLDLIPRDKQTLASRLHAAYTEEAVEQVRRETADLEALDPDSESAWWLAACSVCEEEGVTQERFLKQLQDFAHLAEDPKARVEAARACYLDMTSTYELRDGVPYGERDGCMQGAYLAGYDLATMRGEVEGEEPLYFIGTFRESLGLEEFAWSAELDRKGRPRSGGVHGSRQYVKCHDEYEMRRALSVARRHLGVPA